LHLGNEATAILPHPLGATLVLGLERLRFDGWSEEFGAPDTHESTSLALAPRRPGAGRSGEPNLLHSLHEIEATNFVEGADRSDDAV